MRPDKNKPYYTAYEKRYRTVYEQGADHWLELSFYEAMKIIIKEYVTRFSLANKKIVEFGCGEGLGGLEFVKLGCFYQGYDIAPAAIKKAKILLSPYSNAIVTIADIVIDSFPMSVFDAGIDVACLHMLVTDKDRGKYLKNVYNCLKPGAPMLFAHENCADTEYAGTINDYEQWLKISGTNVETPIERTAVKNWKVIPVSIPLIAARGKTENGYRKELSDSGFEIIDLTRKEDMVNILVKKPAKL